MNDNFKPGGGNKPQPYIPAGNGDKSSEYTNKPVISKPILSKRKHCFIRNIKKHCNFLHSKLVGRVDNYFVYRNHISVPKTGKANSVIKIIRDGFVVSERYYNNKGEAYLDIDYTCHGNPKSHPEVPHIHKWYKDENGCLRRNEKWESFQ